MLFAFAFIQIDKTNKKLFAFENAESIFYKEFLIPQTYKNIKLQTSIWQKNTDVKFCARS